MRKDVMMRRGAHALVALTPLYYALPENLPLIGWHRWTLVVIFFAGVMLFEAYRLRRGITFIGLRPHERHQIASFAWAAAGITAVLWLCPHDIAAAALIAMALVDPLAGEMRSAGYRDSATVPLSLLVYFALCLSVLIIWNMKPNVESLALASLATVLGVASERFKVRYVDDDFLMAVVPAGAMAALALA